MRDLKYSADRHTRASNIRHKEVKNLGSYEAEERAAILEFEAGYTRQIAESKALAQYAKQIQKGMRQS